MGEQTVTVEGYLSVTDQFACIATSEDAKESVLIKGGLLYFALLREAPQHILGGSMVAFYGHASVSGRVSPSTGFAAFPAALYDLSEVTFEPKHGPAVNVDLRRPAGRRIEIDLFDETPNHKCAVVRMPDRMFPSLVLDAGLVASLARQAKQSQSDANLENAQAPRDLLGYFRTFGDYLAKAAAKHGLPLPRTE